LGQLPFDEITKLFLGEIATDGDLLKIDMAKLTESASLVNNVELNCTFTLKIKNTETAALYTQEINQTITIPLYDSPVDVEPLKILREINETRNTFMATWDWVGDLDKWLNIIKNLCQTFEIFAKVYQALQYFKTPVYILARILDSVISGAGEFIWTAYAGLVGLMQNLKEAIWNGWGNTDIAGPGASLIGGVGDVGIFKRACAAVTCQQCYDPDFTLGLIDEMRTGQSFFVDGMNELVDLYSVDYGVANFTLFGDPLDPLASPFSESVMSPEKSVIVAGMCLCLPGIVTAAQRLRQINCRYVRCLKDVAETPGLSKDLCRAAKDRDECLYWWGSLMAMFPTLNILDFAKSFITTLITQLPARIISAVRSSLCESPGSLEATQAWEDITANPWQSVLCGAVDAFLLGWDQGKWDFDNYVNFLTDQFTGVFDSTKGIWTEDGYVDLCDGLYCEGDGDCRNGEKCYGGVCFT